MKVWASMDNSKILLKIVRQHEALRLINLLSKIALVLFTQITYIHVVQRTQVVQVVRQHWKHNIRLFSSCNDLQRQSDRRCFLLP